MFCCESAASAIAPGRRPVGPRSGGSADQLAGGNYGVERRGAAGTVGRAASGERQGRPTPPQATRPEAVECASPEGVGVGGNSQSDECGRRLGARHR